jgi:mono/diheme cytochrome c family protein
MGRLIVIGIMVCVFAVAQSATAPKRGGNPEAAKIKNPVAATPESLSAGKRVYQRLCVRCHGADGKGDGGSGGAQPSDFTDAQWDYGSSDGDLFSVIHDGTSADMEGYAARMSDTDIWNVVNYIHSFTARK